MLKARKIQLRKEIGELLLRISDEDVKRQSANVTEQIISSAWLGEARTIGVYVSTKGEIQTDDVITHLLAIGKQVFIPNFRRGNPTMHMLQLHSSEWPHGLTSTLWGIRQHPPDAEMIPLKETLDVLLMPGVAFSAKMERLGHGKGFFDKFLMEHEEMFF